MKLRLGSDEYDIDSMRDAPLGAARDLLKLYSIGVDDVQQEFVKAAERANQPGFRDAMVFSDLGFVNAVIGLIFLCKRAAGETVTLLEIESSVSLSGWQLVEEEADEVAPKDLEGDTDPDV